MRFFFSPDGAAVFLPASFFSAGALPAGAFPAVVPAGALVADLGAISVMDAAISQFCGSKCRVMRESVRFGCGLDVVDEIGVVC